MTVPIEPFDDEPTTQGTLGPASLEEAMRPLEMFLGEPVTVFLRDDIDATMIGMPLAPIEPHRLVAMLPAIAAERVGTLLVSDGNMSHALSFLGAKDKRIFFFDPWNSSSFLQAGRNVAGVEARAEGQGQYSVTQAELERVIVAQGVAGLAKVDRVVPSPTWEEFTQSDFYRFFNLRPQGERITLADGFALPHLTGGFREFVSLGFEVDENDRLRSGDLQVQRDWLLDAGRPFGMDLLKSFVDALVVRTMDLARVGVLGDAKCLCPDVHLTDALVDVIQKLGSWRSPKPGPRIDRLMPLLSVVAGRSEEQRLLLQFHQIQFVNRGEMFLARIERLTQ